MSVLEGIGAAFGGLYLLLVYGGAFIVCVLFIFGWFEDISRFLLRKLGEDNWLTKFLKWYFKLPYEIRRAVKVVWGTVYLGICIAIFVWGLKIKD